MSRRVLLRNQFVLFCRVLSRLVESSFAMLSLYTCDGKLSEAKLP